MLTSPSSVWTCKSARPLIVYVFCQSSACANGADAHAAHSVTAATKIPRFISSPPLFYWLSSLDRPAPGDTREPARMFRNVNPARPRNRTQNILWRMSDIVSHYTATPEESRLRSGWGQLEFERTRELILRHLPAAPGTILDVGGGTGIYSAWLGSLGYEAHLVDIVPAQVDVA